MPGGARLPGSEPRPWRRFWARHIDYLLLAAALTLSATFLAPGLSLEESDLREDILWSIATVFLWIFAESGFLWSAGTTPGKWMLGLRVETPEGLRPSYRHALGRSFGVWVGGMGLGIPFVSLFTMLHGYNTLREGGTPSWERRSGLRVASGPIGAARLSTALGTLALVAGLLVWAENSEEPWERQARESVADVRDWMIDQAAEEEIAAEAVGGIGRADASEGEVQRQSLRIPSQGWYAVVGGCDPDCEELGFAVLTPEGDELAEDREDNATPIVYLHTDAPERLDLEARMIRCGFDRCAYAWQLLKADASLRFITQSLTGTCFAVDPDGLILTAHHLVEDAESVSLRFGSGDPIPAQIVAPRPALDLALLEVDRKLPAYLDLAEPGDLEIGERVFTMGFPATDLLGSEVKFSEGSVASLSGAEGEAGFFQMSVAIQPGNSGGPVVDESGRVVGVVSAQSEPHDFEEATGTLPQGVNWAAKASLARRLFTPPPPQPPARSRSEAIERVREAVCSLESR